VDLTTSFESERWFTQEEFAAFCDEHTHDVARYELLNGRIVMNPPSSWPQGHMSSLVAIVLGRHVVGNDLGYVFGADQGFELPSGDTVGPDAAFVSHARFEAAGPHAEDRFLRVVPELVVEILSRSTASRDRGEKRAIYERNGVLEYWLVDHRGRRLTVSLFEDGRYGKPGLFEEDEVFESRALAGLRVRVAEILPSIRSRR
jgi:Uma2 family endonuclease